MHRAHPLIVGSGAGGVRRSLGPTAWAVLEVLAGRADANAVADGSVREVAHELGIAKNTAHRSMQKLVAAGVASPEQGRQLDGRFLRGCYRLTIARDVLQLASGELPVAHEPTVRRSTRSSTGRDVIGTQLDLLADND